MKLLSACIIVFLSVSTSAYALQYSNSQGLQNSNPLCFQFDTSSGSAGSSCWNGQSKTNISCYDLAPSGQEWINIASSGGWFVLNFKVSSYNSITKSCNKDYLGYLSVSFSDNNQKPKVTTQDGNTQIYTVNSTAKLYGLYFFTYTVPQFPTPTVYNTLQYRGVNLSGAEFEKPYNLTPSAFDAYYFVTKGMNTVRIPFRWEYLQPNLGLAIDFTKGYGKQLMDLVGTLSNAGIYVIVDMHNYMRYPLGSGNDGPVIGVDSKATAVLYAKAWQEIAAEIMRRNYNNNYVLLDLMNEPWSSRGESLSSSPSKLSTEIILDNYIAAMTAIRSVGFKGMLLLEGNAFSGLLDWEANYYGTPNATVFMPKNIPDSNYAINVHQYLGQNAAPTTTDCVTPSTLLTLKNFSQFVTWMSTNKVPVILTETGGIPSSNCTQDINIFLSALESNAYQPGQGGFIGWLGWTGGDAWYPVSDSNFQKQFLIAPKINGSEAIQMQQGAFGGHLSAPSQ